MDLANLIAMVTLMKALGIRTELVLVSVIIFLILFFFIFASQWLIINKITKTVFKKFDEFTAKLQAERTESVDKLVAAIEFHSKRFTSIEGEVHEIKKDITEIKKQLTKSKED